MDPVTHTLLGAATGYALFGRRLGRHAAGIGALAAFVPDADVFIRSAADPLLALEYHRQFTHSLAFSVVGSLVVAALWLRHRRCQKQWPWIWLCAWAAYVSHCLLDAATTYGTQLLWPFSRYRVSWDLIAIVDPLATMSLLAGVAWALVRRWPRAATIGVSVFLAYLTLGGVQRLRVSLALNAVAAQRGHVLERMAVVPTLANNVVWRTLYETNGRIYSDRLRAGWFTRIKLLEGGSVPTATLASLTPLEQQRNQATRAFERFAWFSDHWVARVPSDLNVIGDMRYSFSDRPFDPLWGLRFAAPGAAGNYSFESLRRGRRLELGDLWQEIKGGHPGYHAIATGGRG